MSTLWGHADVILRLHGVARGQGERLVLPSGVAAKRLPDSLIIPCAFGSADRDWQPLRVAGLVRELNRLDAHEVQFETGDDGHPSTNAPDVGTLFFSAHDRWNVGPPLLRGAGIPAA